VKVVSAQAIDVCDIFRRRYGDEHSQLFFAQGRYDEYFAVPTNNAFHVDGFVAQCKQNFYWMVDGKDLVFSLNQHAMVRDIPGQTGAEGVVAAEHEFQTIQQSFVKPFFH
jgi:hypothetical protein